MFHAIGTPSSSCFLELLTYRKVCKICESKTDYVFGAKHHDSAQLHTATNRKIAIVEICKKNNENS